MPDKATNGGVLIYVKNGIDFVQHSDLDIKKDKKLESCFIDMINANQQNSIMGVLYRHPTMDQNEFPNDHLDTLTYRLSKENKPIFIARDWNLHLIESSKHEEFLAFYEKMISTFFRTIYYYSNKNQ